MIKQGINPRRIIFYSCDGLRKNDLEQIIKTSREVTTRTIEETKFWFFDEITSTEGKWPAVIKNQRDNTNFGEDCIVLTGSSANKLLDVRKELAGRKFGTTSETEKLLLPMGFKDFCKEMSVDIPNFPMVSFKSILTRDSQQIAEELFWRSNELLNLWEIYLQIGGFPMAVSSYKDQGAVSEVFRDTLIDVLEGQIIKPRIQFSENQLDILVKKITRSLSNPLKLSSKNLLEDLNIENYHVVEDRIEDLIKSYFIWKCHKANNDNIKNYHLGTSSKYYFIDPFLAQLTSLRHRSITPPSSSLISEQQIGLCLLRQAEKQSPGSFLRPETLMFYQPNKEIDFVADWMEGMACEGKYVDNKWKQEVLTLKNKIKDGTLEGGAFATRGILEYKENVAAIPAPILNLMIEGNEN